MNNSDTGDISTINKNPIFESFENLLEFIINVVTYPMMIGYEITIYNNITLSII